MNRNDFQALSRTRIKEAKALLALGYYSGAYYLAGYSVECALKACIAKETARFDFPPDRTRTEEVYRHSAIELLKAAKLGSALDAALDLDPALEKPWKVVSKWSEQDRYRHIDKGEAHDMIEAVANREHGVLPWVKRYW
jgi:HEPN domain-containing protein